MVTKAFGLGGTILFSTYTPDAFQPDATGKCAFRGDSHNFVVYATNANPIAATRLTVVVNALVANSFIEQGQTKNKPPPTGSPKPPLPPSCDPARLQDIEDKLALQFCPKTSRVGHYWWDVKTVDQNTKLTCITKIPLCIAVKNWKEY